MPCGRAVIVVLDCEGEGTVFLEHGSYLPVGMV
jgi:hypothetical protein